MADQRETMVSVKGLEEALLVVFQNNFDADTKTCLITLMKLLDNVLHKPGNPKVRTIRLSNTAFHEKVGCRKGGIEFLEACGFQRQIAQAAILSSTPSGEETLVLENEKQSHLITARRLLMTRAIQDLGIKSEELPQYRQPPTVNNASGQATTAGGSSFNPYAGHRFDAKSAAVGANLGPDSNYVSPTETQLQRLQKQQAEMETKLQNLQNREWIATLPGQSLPLSSTSNTPQSEQPSDSALLAARMKQQQEQQRQREQGSLTTKAMRDLEQLKKKKVYSHAVLTIQFADGCKLLGKFLPKETIQAVKQEIQQVMDDATREFDLYVAPPRRLLDNKHSLQQEGLVPASKIFVSWKVASAPDKNAAPGSYLQSHLFSQTSASLFPSAQPVVMAESDSNPAAVDSKKPASKKKKSNREESLLKRMMGK